MAIKKYPVIAERIKLARGRIVGQGFAASVPAFGMQLNFGKDRFFFFFNLR